MINNVLDIDTNNYHYGNLTVVCEIMDCILKKL